MALTKEERNKIIEEETLRNEVRSENTSVTDNAITSYLNIRGFLTILVIIVVIVVKTNN